MTTIDNTNYELHLVRYAEGLLTPEERKAVERWLEEHPDAAEELSLYQEAPRLQRDETIRYAPAAQPHPWPIGPMLLRWSAAAVAITALMMPAMRTGRMGTLPQREDMPVMVAEEKTAKDPVVHEEVKYATHRKSDKITANAEVVMAERPTEPTPPAPSDTTRTVIPTTHLIAFEQETPSDEPQKTNALIVRSPDDWGDRLLALNDATHENLSNSFVGRQVSRLLPDSDQLAEHVVDPLREGWNNLRNKLK